MTMRGVQIDHVFELCHKINYRTTTTTTCSRSKDKVEPTTHGRTKGTEPCLIAFVLSYTVPATVTAEAQD